MYQVGDRLFSGYELILIIGLRNLYCITESVDGMIKVIDAEEYPRPEFDKMIKITVNLLDQYDIRFDNRSRVFADVANPSFIRALEDRVDEDSDDE